MLRSAGIDRAKIVAVCTQQREITDQIVELVQTEYPNARIFARSYDRIHTIALRNKGVDYELRETFESGLLFGRKTLEGLGIGETEAFEIGDDIRKRDEQRLELQASEGLQAGRDMLLFTAGQAGTAGQTEAHRRRFQRRRRSLGHAGRRSRNGPNSSQ